LALEVDKISREERHAIANRYLDLVGLEGFGDYYPHQVSGGMQQRVGIARALARDPQILLMDEPFGAVDAQTREQLQEELLKIWEATRKTVLFVTHSIDEAIYLSDRVVVLESNPGRVRNIVPIDLPRPRQSLDLDSERRMVELRRHVRSMLRGSAGGNEGTGAAADSVRDRGASLPID
jgi:NitT/TauT family transport system ATP-binding protein